MHGVAIGSDVERNRRGRFMGTDRRPFSAIRLHDFDERCWGVVNGDGALVDVDGLSMKLTKAEAQALAAKMNETEPAQQGPGG